jgi:tetratricopeptide (TPR) repeat protein
MPTVFVSSTSRDLGPYREAALLACRELGLAASGMEDFEAMGLGATAGSLHKLDQADVYLGIFAHRYGFIEPGHDRSVTECEFDHARKRGLECLCFVVDGKYPWPPDAIEFEQRARLDGFKKRIAELIINWFTTVEDFQHKVHKALAAWKQRAEGAMRPAPAVAVRPSLVPRQLPPAPKDFIGRDDILTKLDGQFGGAVAISGLYGLGGVGKTVLALRLAERLAPRYPDGHIYLDLKGVDPRPLTWQEAMAHLLHAFHPEDGVPPNDADLAGRYRSVLSGRRVLLLWDNAACREQVEPLLPPGEDSLVLITSRRRFHLPGLAGHDLDALSAADATALLRTIAPRLDESLASALAERCGCLPLALRLAGAVLAERDDLSPQRYLQRLQTGRMAELDGVTASLRLSEELLPEPLRSKWCELVVLSGAFESAWGAAVWGVDEATADAHLGVLRRGSLLGWDAAAELYRLHDLVREYAAGRLDAAARAAAERRHARYFCQAARDAAALFDQGGARIAEALRAFDRTWANVREGFVRTRSRAPGDDELAGLCRDYSNETWRVREVRQHCRDQQAWSEAATEASRHLADRHGEGTALGTLGRAYLALGQPQKALEFHFRHLELARAVGHRRGETRALGDLGSAYAVLGHPEKAAEFHRQRLELAREIGDRSGEASALGNLGLSRADLGQPQQAAEFHRQHLELAREIGNRRGEGRALYHLGDAYAALGQPHKAIEVILLGLALVREVGDRRSESNALGALGRAYAALGQPQRAVDLYQEGLAITREIGYRWGEARAAWSLGLALAEQGRLAEAVPLMEVRVRFLREIGHPDADKNAVSIEQLRQRLPRG